MGDGLSTDDYKSIKMGASSNPNALRLATLQDKKRNLEETIAKRNQELRQLCLKEAELTGITPSEIPTEAGESPSSNRRKVVGTSYQLNILNSANTEDVSASNLEIQLQFHTKMAEAAVGLANDANSSKTLRRQHMSEYEHHRTQCNVLQDKLNQLQGIQQSPSPNHQQKQKKKPRPLDQEDAVSVNLNVNDMFGKSVLRHSMRSLQHPLYSTEPNEYKFSSHPKLTYRNSDDNLYIENAQHMKNEDALISNFYKLNLSKGLEPSDGIDSPHNMVQYVPSTPTLPLYQQYVPYPKSQNHVIHPSPPQMVSPSGSYELNMHIERQDYHQYKIPHSNTQGQLHKNIPSLSNQKISYLPSTPTQYLYSNPYTLEQPRSYNPLQIQPHQQYEHDVMTSGLGGHWKKKENGDVIWCNANFDNVWQRDKRCGSLDRRKNKRLHKRISPNVDVKCATLSSVPLQNEPNRNIVVQMPQNAFRNRQDNCQLVRTQSLGSVGVQTLDSVWPSDDNSSCGSETHSFNDSNPNARKQKQKEWYETALDDPVPPAPRTPRSLSTIPSILPDVKYTDIPLTNYMSSPIPKSVIEIPAESNPSPKMSETNIELFNNNIPKNCTVVTAGHCKPYHEETKPFEMSDFYKYSTKFKKSPSKDTSGGVIQKGVYQPLQPMTCQPFSPITNSNGNMSMVLDSPLLIPSSNMNASPQDFQQEINAWYKTDDHNDNNNKDCSHSTATLV